jgi:hypothetical protein
MVVCDAPRKDYFEYRQSHTRTPAKPYCENQCLLWPRPINLIPVHQLFAPDTAAHVTLSTNSAVLSTLLNPQVLHFVVELVKSLPETCRRLRLRCTGGHWSYRSIRRWRNDPTSRCLGDQSFTLRKA